jgi:AcrR family transcriptional regulator
MKNHANGVTIDGGPKDGRTARRDRNKNAVLDAVIELFSEGNLSPSVHDVARRSGVSLRSVYRYFEDVEDLVAAAIARHHEQFRDLFDIPDAGRGTTHERIHHFCRRRMKLFTAVRPAHLAAAIRMGEHPQLAARVAERKEQLRRQTATMFAAELEELEPERANVVHAMLDSLSQFELLDYQYRLRSHDADDTAAFLVDAFTEILT